MEDSYYDDSVFYDDVSVGVFDSEQDIRKVTPTLNDQETKKQNTIYHEQKSAYPEPDIKKQNLELQERGGKKDFTQDLSRIGSAHREVSRRSSYQSSKYTGTAETTDTTDKTCDFDIGPIRHNSIVPINARTLCCKNPRLPPQPGFFYAQKSHCCQNESFTPRFCSKSPILAKEGVINVKDYMIASCCSSKGEDLTKIVQSHDGFCCPNVHSFGTQQQKIHYKVHKKNKTNMAPIEKTKDTYKRVVKKKKKEKPPAPLTSLPPTEKHRGHNLDNDKLTPLHSSRESEASGPSNNHSNHSNHSIHSVHTNPTTPSNPTNPSNPSNPSNQSSNPSNRSHHSHRSNRSNRSNASPTTKDLPPTQRTSEDIDNSTANSPTTEQTADPIWRRSFSRDFATGL